MIALVMVTLVYISIILTKGSITTTKLGIPISHDSIKKKGEIIRNSTDWSLVRGSKMAA